MFRNHLLSSLGTLTLAELLPHLREVTLVSGQALCEAGEMPMDVYFPNTAVISIVTLLRDGRSYEVSSVGYEGAANLFPSLTGIPSQTRTFVQVPGTCLRLPVATLRSHLEGRASLLRHLLAYSPDQQRPVGANDRMQRGSSPIRAAGALAADHQ